MNGEYLLAQKAVKYVILAVLLLTASGCHTLEHHILYNPDPFPEEWTEPTQSELEGLHLEEAHFNSIDGTRLHGWFVKPADMETGNVILFAHGRAGNVTSTKSRLFDFVRRHQVAVLKFDYRGFGKSEGEPSEEGLYQDIASARNWLIARTKIDPSEVIIMGHSLGAAIAIDLASREGGKALIVESGFASVPDLVRYYSGRLLRGRLRATSFDSVSKIGNFSGPVFISHGRKDIAVPFRHAVRLSDAATNASFVQIVETNGGHKYPTDDGYKTALGDFLKRL